MSSAETQTAANRFRFLVEAAAWRYREQGLAARRAVRKALLGDPLHRELLAPGRLPAEGLVLHLGCGRGALLALLACARPPGARPRLLGVEPDPGQAESARKALAGRADIATAGLAEAEIPPCRAAILLDILHPLPPGQQDALLERLAAALEDGGQMIVREPDAGRWGCRAALAARAGARGLWRGERGARAHPRSGEDWRRRLEALGLAVETLPAGGGWPAKAVLAARKNAPAENPRQAD